MIRLRSFGLVLAIIAGTGIGAGAALAETSPGSPPAQSRVKPGTPPAAASADAIRVNNQNTMAPPQADAPPRRKSPHFWLFTGFY